MTSQVVEAGEEKIEAVKGKVDTLKNELFNGFKKTVENVEEDAESLATELLEGADKGKDAVETFVDEIKDDLK